MLACPGAGREGESRFLTPSVIPSPPDSSAADVLNDRMSLLFEQVLCGDRFLQNDRGGTPDSGRAGAASGATGPW